MCVIATYRYTRRQRSTLVGMAGIEVTTAPGSCQPGAAISYRHMPVRGWFNSVVYEGFESLPSNLPSSRQAQSLRRARGLPRERRPLLCTLYVTILHADACSSANLNRLRP
jgi:hypothetical protein